MESKLLDFALHLVKDLGYSIEVAPTTGPDGKRGIVLLVDIEALDDDYLKRYIELINKGIEMVGKRFRHSKQYINPSQERLVFYID